MKKLEVLLTKLAADKKRLDELEAQSKPLKEELDATKFELMLLMQKTGSKRTEAVQGYYVTRSERKTPIIVNDGEVLRFIDQHGFERDEYLKLDPTRVKAMAESVLKETGEIMGGLEFQTTEYLTVKGEK